LYTRLCSGLLFPLHERIKGHNSTALLEELERTQWLEPGDLSRLQLARLRGFLAQAQRSVPYYRTLFRRCGFDPARLDSLADLRRIPFLTKVLIRAHGAELKAENAGRLIRYNTGGSTGEPLVFQMGRERVSHDVAAKWRATRWWGVDIGDPELVLWGSPIEVGAQDRMRSLRDWVFRSRLLPAFDMSQTRMDAYLAVIRRMRPRMMFGYASALARLAAHVRSTGVPLHEIGVRVVFVTGETLYPDQRQVIEASFGAPVANGYGARDAGFIAHQCPSGSLHVSSEHVVVELVDGEGSPVTPGERGEVVVTHLATGAFPFIRYRTGDMAVQSRQSCACGRGLPVLEQVLGRSTDFIRTRSGTVMHALALIYEVRGQPGVRAFKFLQAADHAIDLQVAADAEFTSEVEARTLAGLRRRLGPDTPIRISRVEHIPPERSGKYRYVVSQIPVDQAC
jgi:phenylacetate-CoA ligase